MKVTYAFNSKPEINLKNTKFSVHDAVGVVLIYIHYFDLKAKWLPTKTKFNSYPEYEVKDDQQIFNYGIATTEPHCH